MSELNLNEIVLPEPDFYTVKAPVFSYQKLAGLDPILEAEMKSTGELMSMSTNLDEAFLKAFVWSQQSKPKLFTQKTGSIFIDIAAENEKFFTPYSEQLQNLGFELVTNDFNSWVQTEEAIALISLPKLGTKDGTEKRQEALRQRCSVISELTTLQVMLKALAVTNLDYYAIQDWWLKEKELIK